MFYPPPKNIMPHVKNTEALLLLLENVQVQHKRTKCRLKLEMLTGNQEDVSSQLNTIHRYQQPWSGTGRSVGKAPSQRRRVTLITQLRKLHIAITQMFEMSLNKRTKLSKSGWLHVHPTSYLYVNQSLQKSMSRLKINYKIYEHQSPKDCAIKTRL